MAARSYLRRIAAPLNPAEPFLSPLPVPQAGEAMPPRFYGDAPPVLRRRSAPAGLPIAPTDVAALPIASFPAGATPSLSEAAGPAADAPRLALLSAIGADTSDAVATPSLSEAAGPAADAPRLALQPDADASDAVATPTAHHSAAGEAGIAPAHAPDTAGALSPRPSVRATRPRPGVHIGTVEVRTRSAPPSPTPPVQASMPASARAAAPSQPLARGLAWRYGLVQS